MADIEIEPVSLSRRRLVPAVILGLMVWAIVIAAAVEIGLLS
jgi:hypothetical protein